MRVIKQRLMFFIVFISISSPLSAKDSEQKCYRSLLSNKHSFCWDQAYDKEKKVKIWKHRYTNEIKSFKSTEDILDKG